MDRRRAACSWGRVGDEVLGLDYRWLPGSLAVLLLLAAEAGYRVGLRGATDTNERLRAQISAVQAAMLALLGLLLGFSFSSAMDRFEARRDAVVLESNAIGIAWLRADLLAAGPRDEEKRLLREYVDVRIAYYGGEAEVEAAIAKSDDLQRRMWTIAVAEARSPSAAYGPLRLLDALADVIQDQNQRVAAARARVPEVVILLLAVFSVAGLAIVGVNFGFTGRRGLPATLALTALVSSTIYVVLDLDRPMGRLVHVSRAGLHDLRRFMDEMPRPGG